MLNLKVKLVDNVFVNMEPNMEDENSAGWTKPNKMDGVCHPNHAGRI